MVAGGRCLAYEARILQQALRGAVLLGATGFESQMPFIWEGSSVVEQWSPKPLAEVRFLTFLFIIYRWVEQMDAFGEGAAY